MNKAYVVFTFCHSVHCWEVAGIVDAEEKAKDAVKHYKENALRDPAAGYMKYNLNDLAQYSSAWGVEEAFRFEDA